MTTEQFRERVNAALEKSDQKLLAAVAFDVVTDSFSNDVIANDTLDVIVQACSDSRFLAMSGGWHFLTVVRDLAGRLTRSQRRVVLEALNQAFRWADDWMTPFYVSELIGTRFADRDGLAFSNALHDADLAIERLAVVPHLIGHIINRADDLDVAQTAFDELMRFARDESDVVRREAAKVIRSLSQTHTIFDDNVRSVLHALSGDADDEVRAIVASTSEGDI